MHHGTAVRAACLALVALGAFLARPKMNPLIVLFGAGLVNVAAGRFF